MIDATLVQRYVVGRDPSAFRQLVDRHGPAVLRTCRGVLGDAHEAEDAFQATFLVFARKAPSLSDPERINRWLVGVARRVAVRARRRGVRRADRERRWAELRPTDRVEEGNWPLLEARRAVRDELDRLPEAYRRPLELCYLEGLTHEEAAARLGCPAGTVKTRLVRGRRLLRDRLDRRGVGLAVVFLLLLLRREAGAMSTDEALRAATAEALTLAKAGGIAALEARFPRAVELSRAARLPIARPGLMVAVLIILGLLAFASAGFAWSSRAQGIRLGVEASARLKQLLEAACR